MVTRAFNSLARAFPGFHWLRRASLALLCAMVCATLALPQSARYDTPVMKPLAAGGLTAVSGLASVCSGSGLTTTAASLTGNVVTLTMSSNPLTAGFINGRDVLIIGFSPTDTFFNGSFTLTSVSTTQLQFALTHGNATAGTNGGAVMKPTSTLGCAPTVNVYSDAALSTLLTQPFPDDGKGNIQFWTNPGTYYVAFSASGVNPNPLYPITLGLVPNASGALVSPTLTSPTTTGTDAGAETLQNKTLTGASSGNSVSILNAQANAGAITGNGSAQNVYTYSLPAGTVANLKGVRVTVSVNHSTGSASVAYALTLNGVSCWTNSNALTGYGSASFVFLNTGA